MYTKARIAGHPIHPMLIAFPVALYVATTVALIVFAANHDPFWYRAAFWANLAGVVMAAVAAIPGAIDLFTTVPGRSKARVTGYKHAGANVLALVLFVISDILIGRSLYQGAFGVYLAAPLILCIVGCLATVAAGWYGWTMVQTHHVGVKPTARTFAGTYEEVDDLDELVVPPVATGDSGYPMHH